MKELKTFHVTLCPKEKITSKSNIEAYLLHFEKENVNIYFWSLLMSSVNLHSIPAEQGNSFMEICTVSTSTFLQCTTNILMGKPGL